MIPLVWILLIWLAGVTIFLILSLLTITLALRFGVSGLHTFFFCAMFLAVSALVIGGVALFALNVDWSQTIAFGVNPAASDTFLFP